MITQLFPKIKNFSILGNKTKSFTRFRSNTAVFAVFHKQKDGPKSVDFVCFVLYQNKSRAPSVPTAIALPLVL